MKVQKEWIKTERVKLTVPHEGEEITFRYPPISRKTYCDIARGIEEEDLAKPTMAQITSLIYNAWQNPNEEYCKKVIDFLGYAYNILTFSGIRYVPNEGAYIQDLPEFLNYNIVIPDKESLIKKLEEKDSFVRFVPFGYKIADMSSKELENNPFIIGLAGEQGAKKLGQIALKHGSGGFNSVLWNYNNVDKEILSISRLCSRYDEFGNHFLGIICTEFDNCCQMTTDFQKKLTIPTGFAFGLEKLLKN
jgi:hypothetical protein